MRPVTAPSAINREAAGLPSASSSTGVWQPESASGPTEIVVRPKGLRHGVFEAPKWAFWTTASLVLVAGVVYALFRLGFLRRRKAR